MDLVGVKHKPTFLYNYLQPAIETGLIELTIPDKPTNSKQKYKLTEKVTEQVTKQATEQVPEQVHRTSQKINIGN